MEVSLNSLLKSQASECVMRRTNYAVRLQALRLSTFREIQDGLGLTVSREIRESTRA